MLDLHGDINDDIVSVPCLGNHRSELINDRKRGVIRGNHLTVILLLYLFCRGGQGDCAEQCCEQGHPLVSKQRFHG